MLSSNRKSTKPLASAILISLGFTYFFLRCLKWSLDEWSMITDSELNVEKLSVPLIPENIWYKAGPKGINEETREWMNTCLEKNPTFEHEVMTDVSADSYVIERFSHRPDIVKTYLALSIPILKADLLRYLLLYSEGGLWSDLDVSCGDTTIRGWIPEEYKKDANLVIGWEFQTVNEGQMREFVTWISVRVSIRPYYGGWC